MSKLRPVAPIFRSASGRYLDWLAIIERARRLPNSWWLAESNVPTATVRAVNERRHIDLKNVTGGRLQAQARNVYMNDDDRERCDFFIRFVPSTPEEER